MVLRYQIIERAYWIHLIIEHEHLTEEIAPRLKAHFIALGTVSVPYLILDLSNVKTIDTAGLASLLQANRVFKSKGGFYVTGIQSEMVKALIRISALDTVLTIREGVVDAMKEIEERVAGGR